LVVMALPDILPKTRIASIEFYKSVLQEAADKDAEALEAGRKTNSFTFIEEAKRWLARNDLFFLLVVLLHRPDLNHDWLFARCREVQAEPNGRLDLWAREHYKLCRIDEPVPTPTGWARHGDLEPGDTIFGGDGRPCRVVARTEVFEAPPQYRLTFDDGFKIVTGDDHLWAVERRTRRRGAGGQRLYRETVTLSTREIAAHDHRPDNRLAVPVAGPLQLPEADLSINPYTLGVWLGDGSRGGGSITSGDPEVFEEIRAAGYALGHDKTPARKAQYRCVEGLSAALKALGIRDQKAIPPEYLRASLAQRIALLQGLMDTDGHCNTRGTATFVNINERLVDGFVELCHSLGLKPRRRQHIGTVRGEPYPYWQVSFQAYTSLPPFRLKRKLARCIEGERPAPRRYIVSIERVAPKPGSCIQVDRPDGLYLVGRAMVPTHNSTIITFGLTIQDVLASHGGHPEPRYNGREVTVGIFSHNKSIATDFLSQIKQEFENNGDLKALFPDVLWQSVKEAPSWSVQNGITVRRKTNPKEATVEGHGLVDGMPTGAHFYIRVYDDVVTEDSVGTAEQINKTTRMWELSDNLGTEGGWVRYIGTRYHLFDTYSVMDERDVVTVRLHPCTLDGSENFAPENCAFRSSEWLQEKRKTQGPYTFGAQMLLDPVADKSQGFKEEWLKYWPGGHARGLNVYILVDPASGRKARQAGGNTARSEHAKKADLDYTVMEVIGLGADQNYYTLDRVRDRLNLTERTDTLFALHRQWKPIKVGYEEYGLQADIEHIEYVQEDKNYRFTIVPLSGPLSKQDRIKKLIPIYENGRWFEIESIVRTDWEGKAVNLTRSFVQEEYLAFPVVKHDDILDAKARILDPDFPIEWPKAASADTVPDWMRKLQDQKSGKSWMGR